MDKITIRPAKWEDTKEMREVAIRSFTDTFVNFNSPENLEAFLSDSYSLAKMQQEHYEPDSLLYLACESEKIIGFIRLRKTNEVSEKLGFNTLEIQRLYIDTPYKGRHIGKRLMETALQYAAARKFEWVWLGVWEKNDDANRFYAKWGFEKFGEHIFQMGDDAQTDWLLKKRVEI